MMPHLRAWLERAKLRRLEKRGDVVVGWSESLLILTDLAEDMIPGPERELSRDLFGLIAFTWAAKATPGAAYDPLPLLRVVRDRAWLGYTEPATLIAQVVDELPHSTTGRRMRDFFAELAEKRSSYWFLPIVSRIERHQSAEGPLPIGDIELDGFSERYGDTELGRFAHLMFALAPEQQRDRDALLLALVIDAWGRGTCVIGMGELQESAAVQLRRLYSDPEAALAQLRSELSEPTGDSGGDLAVEVVSIVQEVAARAPWLWLETLFIVENWIGGPQYFGHAFAVTPTTQDQILDEF